jgi:putative thioredoxin
MDTQSFIFDATPQNFQTDVIERSRQVPVLILFWAQQDAGSAAARVTLEKLVGQFQGKAALALVDIAQDQSLAQHLRVQALPSLRVIQDGQMVEQLEGPQPESAYASLLELLTMSSSEVLKSQLGELLSTGDFATALGLLQQAIKEEPHTMAFRVELADVFVRQDALDEARKVLEGIPEETAERDRPQTRLAIAEEAAELGARQSIADAYAADPENLELCFQLAVLDAARGEFESALEHAMSILQKDREFRDDIGRTTMIRIFAILGKGSELTTRYRRRMFNYMH